MVYGSNMISNSDFFFKNSYVLCSIGVSQVFFHDKMATELTICKGDITLAWFSYHKQLMVWAMVLDLHFYFLN